MSDMLDDMVGLAKRAGDIMLDSIPHIVQHKGGKENYVTQVDLEIQEFLSEALMELEPGSSVLGEEGNKAQAGQGAVWIVDPIDGTANYDRSIPMSVVSIARYLDGKVREGVVYNPFVDEMYYASEGEGSFLNGIPLQVSSRIWEDSMVSTAWSVYNKEWSDYCFDISRELHSQCEDLRRIGTAAYEMCLLARGSIDMFFELRLFPWDYAAASLIISEAGGYCTSIDSGLDMMDQCTTICGNTQQNCDRLRELVASKLDGFRIDGSIW